MAAYPTPGAPPENVHGVVRTIPQPRPHPATTIHKAEPKRFNEARDLGEKFREGIPVIMNLQGTEDPFARFDLIQDLVHRLGRWAVLHTVEGGDHSFRVLKRSGRSDAEVLDELCTRVAKWIDETS